MSFTGRRVPSSGWRYSAENEIKIEKLICKRDYIKKIPSTALQISDYESARIR